MKSSDHFSSQAEAYSRFRPSYPPELFNWLNSLLVERNEAWDCGTGSGQVAKELARQFKHVYATDISENQLKHAFQAPNITYRIGAAEKAAFTDAFFDLITVAQAIHWFDFDAFYKQVKRTLKPTGIFAVIGYGLPQMDTRTTNLLRKFYLETLGPYWDDERKYIDEHYRTIPFPFEEIQSPSFQMNYSWNVEQFTGFLSSWSAVQHYIKKNGTDPLPDFSRELERIWPAGELKTISFPVLLRAGKLK